jgi:nucleoside-diphosphate-sugar epimerase
MRVLLLGGNRFLGIEVATRLLARKHDVTLLNRGSLPDPFGKLVTRLRVDRDTDAFDEAIGTTTWDVAIDCALFTASQARRTVRVLHGRVGHHVVLSTGQVYLVRSPSPSVAKETDFDGALMPRPIDPVDLEQWQYGVDKREVETIARALPFTHLRIPMVHGGRDYKRRIDSILYRLLDGGPILLTRPKAEMRHVFAPTVAALMVKLAEESPQNAALNVAPMTGVTVNDFIHQLGTIVGVVPQCVVASSAELRANEIEPALACAFNTDWMSVMDGHLALERVGFRHPPHAAWLEAAVHAVLSRWEEAPPSWSQRKAELRFAASHREPSAARST